MTTQTPDHPPVLFWGRPDDPGRVRSFLDRFLG